MNQLLSNLVESLREELKQYGELLAQLDHQQQLVVHRQTRDLLQSVAGVNLQAETVQAARREREQHQRHVAQHLRLGEHAAFNDLLPLLPPAYQPLLQALIEENNALLIRVQQRARQNQLLMSHAVELMQRFINAILPGANPATYNDAGRMPVNSLTPNALYEAVG